MADPNIYGMTAEEIMDVIQTPGYEHIMYSVPPLYDDARKKHESLWGKIPPAMEYVWNSQHAAELLLKELIIAERARRVQKNIRALFWGVRLLTKMNSRHRNMKSRSELPEPPEPPKKLT